MIKKLGNQKLILVMLSLFSISIGLWGNFRQLWLADNGLTASAISRTICYASILAALYLIYYTNVVSVNKIKWGMIVTLILKIIVSTCLSIFNGCGNIVLLKFFFFVDIACENIILSSIYPLIISYQKNEDLYGKKSVIQHTFKTVGILIGSLIFGRVLIGNLIDYNACLIISIFFLVLSFFILLLVNDQDKNVVSKSGRGVIKYLVHHKNAKVFLCYTLLANVTFNIVTGLQMLILTHFVKFSTDHATFYVLLFSILAAIFGQLSLKRLRSKNDYINISIKFLVRAILCLLVFLTNNIYVLLGAMSYFLLTNVAYDYVLGGFVYNEIENQYSMSFTVMHYIFNLMGEALGVFLAGIMYVFGFQYIFLTAFIVMVFQLVFAYLLVYIKRKSYT